MRFQLFQYPLQSWPANVYFIRDTAIECHRKGAYLMRDPSNIKSDNGKFVWKHAANPLAVHDYVCSGGAIMVAQADSINFLPAHGFA